MEKITILIADDSADAADSLAEYLRMLGHDVHVAYSGLEALTAARSLQPDAAILDIGMPGINGYEVSRAIRAEPWSSRIRLIAVSGWGQHKDKRDAHDAGFDAHLTKPIEPSQVESLLYESRHG